MEKRLFCAKKTIRWPRSCGWRIEAGRFSHDTKMSANETEKSVDIFENRSQKGGAMNRKIVAISKKQEPEVAPQVPVS